MPRCGRLDAPGAIQHVMARGVDRCDLFRLDDDRRRYLGHLEAVVSESSTRVLAWSLMSNHVHLLVRTGTVPVSALMQRLGTRYAAEFNRRHGRVGHLFQGRFKSVLVEEDAYWMAVVRYVHLNPVAAGLVTDVDALREYPWTGHAALMGGTSPGFQDVSTVLLRFGDDPGRARRRLVAWMSDGERRSEHEPRPAGATDVRRLPEHRDCWLHRDAGIRGTPAGVAKIVAARSESTAKRLELIGDATPNRLIDEVCQHLGVSVEQVRCGSRRTKDSQARAVVAYLVRTRLGVSFGKLAPLLGVSPSALARQVERGRRIAAMSGLDPAQVHNSYTAP